MAASYMLVRQYPGSSRRSRFLALFEPRSRYRDKGKTAELARCSAVKELRLDVKNLLDNKGLSLYYYHLHVRAGVVELVDALRSGRSGSNPVGVRVPPSARMQGPPLQV